MDTPSGVHLVCAPAGTDLGYAVERLKDAFSSEDVDHTDIDEVLCSSPETADALTQAGESRPVHREGEWPTMYHVTWSLSRPKIAELWQHAVRESLHRLDRSNKPIRLLSGHLVYYGGRRDEFYSVVTARPFLSLDSLRPSSIFLLIDDVYDMYLRLTENKQLYAHVDRVKQHLDRMRREESIPSTKQMPRELDSYFCTEWELGVMTHLLAWRHLEVVTAENLALQLGVKFLVFGVKHPVAGAANWFKNSAPVSVYFSHPVSRPRRIWREKRRWHPVVAQFNATVDELVSRRVVCVKPTSIDEYRISKPYNGKKRGGDFIDRLPSLDNRWPVSVAGAPLLYCKPRRARDMNHTDLLKAKNWDPGRRKLIEWKGAYRSVGNRKNISILLRALERQIQFQVSSRDHLLVSHTCALFVFRPFFLEGQWSSGVQAEINHWELLAKSDPTKKAIFMHFDEDLRVRARAEKEPARIHIEVEDAVVDILESDYHLARDKAKQILTVVRSGSSGMLDSGPLPLAEMTRIKDDFLKIKSRARESVLFEKLTGINRVVASKVRVMVLLVKGPASLQKEYGKIVHFLTTGEPPPVDWERMSKMFFSNLGASGK